MKIGEKKHFAFPKPKEAPPTFPVTKVSNNVVVDSNGTFYDIWDYNGETIYSVKFHTFMEAY